MKLQFKIIPFVISLLIVVGVTFGICWYSYHSYEGNKLLFLNDYFHEEDYETQESSLLIKHAVLMQANKYRKADSKITFLNSDDYSDISTDNTDSSIPYYTNGTLHLPNYFDIDIYILGTETNGDWTYNYYFYLYNINYKHSNFDPENIQLLLVNGTGNATEEEKEADNYKAYGFDLLDTCYEELFDDDTSNNPSITAGSFYRYTYTGENAQTTMFNIYDSKFINDENREEGADHLVFRMVPKTDNNHNKLDDSTKITSNDVSFCLFYNDDDNYYKIVNGTIEDITTLSNLEYEEGYAGNPTLVPEYKQIIFGKVILHGSIAFVLSFIVAFLFYLIWMDDIPAHNKKINKK